MYIFSTLKQPLLDLVLAFKPRDYGGNHNLKRFRLLRVYNIVARGDEQQQTACLVRLLLLIMLDALLFNSVSL